MKWNKFRLKTTTEAEDIVSSMLADLGIEGVEIEDKIPLTESDKEQMFVDILPALNVKKVKSQRQKSYSIMDKRTIKVENYIGKKRSEVQNISLRFTFVGKGNKVIDQLPRKGEYVEEGDTIVIMLGE